ncbi:MAG: hypothetical protein QF551_08865 [Candidatus Marinimicrobia bacterium]|jgi:hypothetical protein|nr:hypothetical protein [Candidatus Neomarinimicrobiota bacterium]
MRYFKRPDGSIFGKVDWIKKKVVSEFKKKGYVECDENGVPLKSAKKKSED